LTQANRPDSRKYSDVRPASLLAIFVADDDAQLTRGVAGK